MDRTDVHRYLGVPFRLAGLLSAAFWMGILWGGSEAAETFFVDVTEEVIAGPAFAPRSIAFGDYDNDGDLDIHVSVGSYMSQDRARNILLRNDRGVFRDVAVEAGLVDVLPTDNAIWLDSTTEMGIWISIREIPGSQVRRMTRRYGTSCMEMTAMGPLRM